mmetsp:Transcript_9872/g.25521  ORF Transcript_9872/g.25521 Transcript_9872/m.25521 type:complete len:219 (+) Transcript_9872:1252-1908(+)
MDQLTMQDGGAHASNGAPPPAGMGVSHNAAANGTQQQSSSGANNPFDLMGDDLMTSAAPIAAQPPQQQAAQPGPMLDLLGGDMMAPQPQQPQPASASELISFGAPDADPLAALTTSQPQQPAAAAAPSMPAAMGSTGGERYQALCDYTPGDTRMLTIKKGEVLLKQREEDGWFYGTNEQGMAGYFPYVFAPGCAPAARERCAADMEQWIAHARADHVA